MFELTVSLTDKNLVYNLRYTFECLNIPTQVRQFNLKTARYEVNTYTPSSIVNVRSL
jgi:hypothetical protein